MTVGGRASGPVLFLGSVATVDLGVRVVLDLLSAGDPVAFAVGGGVLAAEYALEATTITWALGWVVLAAAVFVVTPQLFPQDLLAWGRGLAGRTVFTFATVAFAVSLNSALVGFDVFGPTRVEPPVWVLPAAFVAVFVLVPGTRWRRVPNGCPDLQFLSRPEETPLRTEDPVRPGEFVARVLLIVSLAATFLVLLSRLFPIPEILLVTLAVLEGLRYARGADAPTSGRKDVTERAMLGLGAVWFGPEAVLSLLYAILPLFFVLYFDLRALEMFAGPVDPVAVAFLLATLGVATLSVVVASVRLLERLPKAFLAETADTDVRLAERFGELHPRVPGFMLAPTALLVAFESRVPQFFQEFGPRPPYTLSVAPGELVVVFALAGLAVVVTFRAAWFPDLRLIERDYHATALSGALFVGITLGYGISVGATDPPQARLPVVVLVLIYSLVVLLLSPFVGYELFDREGKTTAETRFDLLFKEAMTALLWIVGFSIFSVLVLTPALTVASQFVPEGIVTLLIGPLAAPITVGLLVRLVLLPFYLPEKLYG